LLPLPLLLLPSTEPEFALWLEAIASGGSYQQLADALTAMAGELNAVRGSTLQLVERFFRCGFGLCMDVWADWLQWVGLLSQVISCGTDNSQRLWCAPSAGHVWPCVEHTQQEQLHSQTQHVGQCYKGELRG
jgi:hypothetical protein